MALSVRLRRAVLLSTSILKDCSFFSIPSSSPHLTLSNIIYSTPSCLEKSSLRAPFQAQSSSFHSSISLLVGRNDREPGSKIPEDEILFEGCDYNHWLITMDFPKDPKPTPEEMVETYVQTLAKVVGSVEEAKKRMYACSTTTYNGFQAVMTEEMSEKFRGLPGVVFILPDSYIDPVNKEYGGDKYENGVITPRPPPIQYGRQGRYGDGNRRRYDQPRYDRPRYPSNQPQNEYQGNPASNEYQAPGRNYAPQQNQAPPGNYGPPGQDGRSFGPPGQDGRNFGPPGQDGRNFGPPRQDGRGYGPPGQDGQNFSPPGQDGRNFGPPGQDGRNFGPPGQDGRNYGPPGQDGRNFGPPGQDGRNYGPPGYDGRNYGPPGQDGRSFGPSGQDGWSNGPPGQDSRSYGPPQGHNPQNMQQGYGRNYGPPQNYGQPQSYGPPPPGQGARQAYSPPQHESLQGQQQPANPHAQPENKPYSGGEGRG